MEKIRAWTESNRTVLSLAAVFALALLLRIPIASIPLERDEGEYAYMAERWLQGEVPYKETFDQKPPGIVALYVVFIVCLGKSPAAIHWGMQIYTLGTLAIVYWLGKQLVSETVGFSAAVFCAFMTSAPCVLGQSANTEMAMILPLTAGLAATLSAVTRNSVRWSFWVGVFAVAALLCKQIALIPATLYLLLIAKNGQARRWRKLAVVLLGGLVPLVLVLGYFLYHDAWHNFYDCVIGHNLSYATNIPLAAYRLRLLVALVGLIKFYGPIYCLAGVALLWGRALRRPASHSPPHPGPVTLLGIWLIFCFLATVVGGRFFEHYFVTTIPATALLAGIGVEIVARRLSTPGLAVRRSYALTALAIIYGVAIGYWYYLPGVLEEKSRRLYYTDIFAVAPQVGQFLAENSRPEDTVFIVGSEPEIYYYAGRRCACRYIFAYPLTEPTSDGPQRRQETLQQLRDNGSKYIVVVFVQNYMVSFGGGEPKTDWCDQILDLVRHSYEVVLVQPINRSQLPRSETGAAAMEISEEDLTSYRAAERKSCLVVYRRKTSSSSNAEDDREP
jgi:4-amino-4-deoxy-L-arabinose transferase-like glycosyltransferase